jgi:hypothetical protein
MFKTKCTITNLKTLSYAIGAGASRWMIADVLDLDWKPQRKEPSFRAQGQWHGAWMVVDVLNLNWKKKRQWAVVLCHYCRSARGQWHGLG